ncbi:MAG: DUF4912 domain-containing protein [Candidatus Omnitrophica bacterium]|nr:DUF4912 domain-containing protein [Candidatus Omnitrophota bacterium]
MARSQNNKTQTNAASSIPSRSPEYVPVRPPTLTKPVSVDNQDLPAQQNNTNITLMARDPHWVHAYWNVAPEKLEEAKHNLGEETFKQSTQTVRVYDVTYKDFKKGDQPNRAFDIDVGPFTHNWYIDSWSDNTAYCADVGLRTPDGTFMRLARSNFVSTPRQGSSGRSEMIWMEVKDDLETQPYVLVENVKKQTEGGVTPHGRRFRDRIFLTEADIRAYYSRLFPLLQRIVAMRLARENREEHQVVLQDGKVVLDDLLIQGLSRSDFLRKVLLGSSAEMVEKGGASETLSSGASHQPSPVRKFFFEIGTELIVYGRTEPDATVWLGDKNIKLRPDGTFTLRFGLPDAGYIPLDFVAQSQDKIEKRGITTSVRRNKTRYSS